MKRIVLLIIMAFLFSGCAALDSKTKPVPKVDWAKIQRGILDCSEEYIDCLGRAGRMKPDSDTFNRATDKCVAVSNACLDSLKVKVK